MELESINLKKFEDFSLNKKELKMVNAGKALDVGMKTSGGTNLNTFVNDRPAICDYSYDAVRYDSNDQSYVSYHGKSNCTFS
jgi:hypothetical protein